jgi:hypothetical protein
MELSILKQLKQMLYKIRRKPSPQKAMDIVEKPKAKTIIKVFKSIKEPRHKVEDMVVHINCKPMTLREIADKYGLDINTVKARYRVGNKGNLLVRPSMRKKTEQEPT